MGNEKPFFGGAFLLERWKINYDIIEPTKGESASIWRVWSLKLPGLAGEPVPEHKDQASQPVKSSGKIRQPGEADLTAAYFPGFTVISHNITRFPQGKLPVMQWALYSPEAPYERYYNRQNLYTTNKPFLGGAYFIRFLPLGGHKNISLGGWKPWRLWRTATKAPFHSPPAFKRTVPKKRYFLL